MNTLAIETTQMAALETISTANLDNQQSFQKKKTPKIHKRRTQT